MIYLVILISIVYIILICMVMKSYFRDVEDTNKRLIELERRILKIEKGGEEVMACGRKGRPKGSKGGGRKK